VFNEGFKKYHQLNASFGAMTNPRRRSTGCLFGNENPFIRICFDLFPAQDALGGASHLAPLDQESNLQCRYFVSAYLFPENKPISLSHAARESEK
jgi:hypothetical protein